MPALVLAQLWEDSSWLLVESRERRAAFLTEAVGALGWADRVHVAHERAELAGRRPQWRAQCQLVTARSFAPAGVTAECGAPFLALGGKLVVADPPGGAPDRWPQAGLGTLGLRLARILAGPPALAVLEQVEGCPPAYPRRVGIPTKRALF